METQIAQEGFDAFPLKRVRIVDDSTCKSIEKIEFIKRVLKDDEKSYHRSLGSSKLKDDDKFDFDHFYQFVREEPELFRDPELHTLALRALTHYQTWTKIQEEFASLADIIAAACVCRNAVAFAVLYDEKFHKHILATHGAAMFDRLLATEIMDTSSVQATIGFFYRHMPDLVKRFRDDDEDVGVFFEGVITDSSDDEQESESEDEE